MSEIENDTPENIPFDLNNHVISLLDKEPFFAAISRHVDKTASKNLPTAGVRITSEGQYEMLYNPDFFAKLTVKERIGVLKHEFYHLVFEHVSSRLPFAEDGSGKKKMTKKWNIATDLAINSHIADELPSMACIPTRGPFKDLPMLKSAEWYMANLPEQKEDGEGNGFDDHEGWGGDPSSEDAEAIKDIAKQRLKEMMSKAAEESAKNGWGTISSEMQKEILARIKSRVDWKSILRYFVKTSQRANKTSTVKRLNKRYAYIHAGKKVERTAKIAVAIDQSGSVGDDMLVKFFSALDSLSKIATFTVIPFDSAVGEKYIYEWKKGQRHKVERVLHGGTCFQSVTDYVNKQGKWDGIVIATDMCAPKPTACNVPRLWATDAACAENPYFATSERIIKVD